MTSTTFNPAVFLCFPREIQVTEAAAKLLDVIAIEEDCTPHLLTVAIWHYHMTSIAEEIQERGDEMRQMDGGSMSREYDDGLATMDVMLPGRSRSSIICTAKECEAARMDIEDFVNHIGGRLTRFA